MEIIKYQDKYYEDLKKICLDTSSEIYHQNEDDLYNMYLNYYVKYESQNVYIVVEDNRCYGYILNSQDVKLYAKKMKEEYIPLIKNKDLKREIKMDVLISLLLKNRYDSHMHIDLDSKIRRQGFGRKLIEIVINNSKGLKGLYLGCSLSNKNALEFYKRVGFKKGFKGFGGQIYLWSLNGTK